MIISLRNDNNFETIKNAFELVKRKNTLGQAKVTENPTGDYIFFELAPDEINPDGLAISLSYVNPMTREPEEVKELFDEAMKLAQKLYNSSSFVNHTLERHMKVV